MRHLPLVTVTILLAACLAPRAMTDSPPASQPATQPDTTPIERALAMLTAEGERARHLFRIEHSTPDFAERFGEPLDPAAVRSVMRQRVHLDPFIDGYIRWQLISFGVPIGTFSDEAFDAFIAQTPELMNNPLATQRNVRFANAMLDRGRIEDEDLDPVTTRVDELLHHAELWEVFRVPADTWWAWVYEQLPVAGPRRPQWTLAHLAATFRSGAPVNDLKRRLVRLLEERQDDASFTLPHREKLIASARQLAGGSRSRIVDLEITETRQFIASIRIARITEEDVNAWLTLVSHEGRQTPPAR